MVVTFEEEYLRELYHQGRCADKRHRFQPEIVKGYQRRIQQLQAVPRPETLYNIHSLHFEALHGDREGLFSIRVNNKYRIEFSLTQDAGSPMLTICNIIELSNHYD